MWRVYVLDSIRTDWPDRVVDLAVRQGWTPVGTRARTVATSRGLLFALRDNHDRPFVEVCLLGPVAREGILAQESADETTADRLRGGGIIEVNGVERSASNAATAVARHLARELGGEVREVQLATKGATFSASVAAATTGNDASIEAPRPPDLIVPSRFEQRSIGQLVFDFCLMAFVGIVGAVAWVLEEKGITEPHVSRAIGIHGFTLGALGLALFGIGAWGAFRTSELLEGWSKESFELSINDWLRFIAGITMWIGFGVAAIVTALDLTLVHEMTLLAILLFLVMGIAAAPTHRPRLFALPFALVPFPRLVLWIFLLGMSAQFTGLAIFGWSVFKSLEGWKRIDTISYEARMVETDDGYFVATAGSERHSHLLATSGEKRDYTQEPSLGTSLHFDSQRRRVWMTHNDGTARVTYFHIGKKGWYEVEAVEGHGYGIVAGKTMIGLAHETGFFVTRIEDNEDTFRRLPVDVPIGPPTQLGERWVYPGKTGFWQSLDDGAHFEKLGGLEIGAMVDRASVAYGLAKKDISPYARAALGPTFTYLLVPAEIAVFDGKAWKIHPLPCKHPTAAVVDQNREEFLVVGCGEGGVWRSTNGGRSFFSWGLQNAVVHDVVRLKDGSGVLVATEALLFGEGVFQRKF